MVRILEKTSESDVPEEFRQYVDKVLQQEWMGEEVEPRVWGKTPFGQYFVFIYSKVVWYAVRLIVDEEHRDFKISREKSVHTSDVLERKEFWTLEGAKEYVIEEYAALTEGIFPSKIPFRIRKLPPDLINNPDFYLKPGDHIQRHLDKILSLGNHEGVYLGNGKVAHINTENSTADGIGVLIEKTAAHARIDQISNFVISPDQEVRVVVHCFRRKSREDICETAQRLAKEQYRNGEYHLLQQNCQHFAAYCVLDFEWMSDKDDLIEKGVLLTGFVIAGSLIYSFLNRNSRGYLEQEEERKAETNRR